MGQNMSEAAELGRLEHRGQPRPPSMLLCAVAMMGVKLCVGVERKRGRSGGRTMMDLAKTWPLEEKEENQSSNHILSLFLHTRERERGKHQQNNTIQSPFVILGRRYFCRLQSIPVLVIVQV